MKEQNVPLNPGCIRKVVIVGGGTAGWMTASALGRYLGSDAPEIILLESSDIATIGVGEATIPSITKFHRALGLDERKLIAATGATFKLGIEFVDWQNTGDRYFHPFGLFGKDVGGVGFHNLYLKISKSGTYDDAWRYSPCAAAAASGRFGPQAANNVKPAGGFPHAFHLDAKLYAAHLRDYAEAKGVFRVEGRVVEVVRRKENGFVQSVVLQDGRTIDGDLFIDCTGGRGLLIGDAMGVDYLDWRDSLPCNRAVVVPSRADSAPALYTRATAKPAGWQWRIPLQHRCGNGYVYSSDHVSDDAAAQELLNDVSDPLETPRILTFRTGRRAEFWRGNVVAIGLSAGFLEPLESTSIHLIQTGVSKLLNLFPDRTFCRTLAAEYNKTMINAFEGVRDFIILHYKATKRTDTTFWDRVREMPIPTSLRDRVELFRESGRFVRDENELFSLESWILVMLGQGIVPERYSPLVDAIDDVLAKSAEEEIRAEITDAVRSMPTHEVYLRSLSKIVDT